MRIASGARTGHDRISSAFHGRPLWPTRSGDERLQQRLMPSSLDQVERRSRTYSTAGDQRDTAVRALSSRSNGRMNNVLEALSRGRGRGGPRTTLPGHGTLSAVPEWQRRGLAGTRKDTEARSRGRREG